MGDADGPAVLRLRRGGAEQRRDSRQVHWRRDHGGLRGTGRPGGPCPPGVHGGSPPAGGCRRSQTAGAGGDQLGRGGERRGRRRVLR